MSLIIQCSQTVTYALYLASVRMCICVHTCNTSTSNIHPAWTCIYTQYTCSVFCPVCSVIAHSLVTFLYRTTRIWSGLWSASHAESTTNPLLPTTSPLPSSSSWRDKRRDTWPHALITTHVCPRVCCACVHTLNCHKHTTHVKQTTQNQYQNQHQ